MHIPSSVSPKQGWAKFLEDSLSKSKTDQRPAEAGTTTPAPLKDSDSFIKATPAADEAEAEGLQAEAGGLRISFHFDLFYQLSQKVQTTMGQSGQQRFVETASTVSEAFKGNFSLKIDAVGSFLKGTDSALNISPETTNEFFDAVDGLADLSPDALSTFLKESDDFFTALEGQYGEAGGVFDDIKAQMQEQASAFFADVTAMREESGIDEEFFGLEGEEGTLDQLPEGAAELPEAAGAAETAEAGEADAGTPITLLVGPQAGTQVSGNQYQEFLSSFLSYTMRFRQSVVNTMLGGQQSAQDGGASSSKNDTDKTGAAKKPHPVHPDTPNGKFPTGYFPASDKAASSLLNRDEFRDAKPEKPVKPSKLDTSA